MLPAGAAAGQHRIRVSCLRTGHSRYVKGTTRVSNHTVWRAVDIDHVDGQAVSPARQLADWIGRGGAGTMVSRVLICHSHRVARRPAPPP